MLFGQQEIRFKPIHNSILNPIQSMMKQIQFRIQLQQSYFLLKMILPHKCFNLSRHMLIIFIAMSMEVIVLLKIWEHGLTYLVSYHMCFILETLVPKEAV